MDNSFSEDQVKTMSKALLSGATLLSKSCPECKIPLFRKDERVFCVSCGRRAVFVASEEEEEEVRSRITLEQSLVSLQAILLGKLDSLTGNLAGQLDYIDVQASLALIEKILAVLKLVEELSDKRKNEQGSKTKT